MKHLFIVNPVAGKGAARTLVPPDRGCRWAWSTRWPIGTEVKVDGEECTIVRQSDILAVVED